MVKIVCISDPIIMFIPRHYLSSITRCHAKVHIRKVESVSSFLDIVSAISVNMPVHGQEVMDDGEKLFTKTSIPIRCGPSTALHTGGNTGAAQSMIGTTIGFHIHREGPSPG